MERPADLSVIVPVAAPCARIRDLHVEYRESLSAPGREVEFVYVLDGDLPGALRDLRELVAEGERLRVIRLARPFGESTAIAIGFDHCRGEVIVTLPCRRQVDPADLPRLPEALDGNDIVAARRSPRAAPAAGRLQSAVYHFAVSRLLQVPVHDIGCGARAFRRKVLEEIPLYGDQSRFLPLLAHRRGFRFAEVDVRPSPTDAGPAFHRPSVYLRSLLDVLSVFFLIRFTKRPLRFFGTVGSAGLAAGFLISAYLVYAKLFLRQRMGDRPLLLLGVLLIVLGVQIIAIGLIGEIVIFTHSREVKEYTIEEVIN